MAKVKKRIGKASHALTTGKMRLLTRKIFFVYVIWNGVLNVLISRRGILVAVQS